MRACWGQWNLSYSLTLFVFSGWERKCNGSVPVCLWLQEEECLFKVRLKNSFQKKMWACFIVMILKYKRPSHVRKGDKDWMFVTWEFLFLIPWMETICLREGRNIQDIFSIFRNIQRIHYAHEFEILVISK